MAKIIKKAKTAEPVKSAVATAVETKEEDLFDPLPSVKTASVSTSVYPPKKYVLLDGESNKRRVFTHTLRKGTDKERTIHFVNMWDPAYSLTITNPTIKQIQELQTTYTRDRGFNLMKFSKGTSVSYTLYRMRVLTQSEFESAFEEE